MVRNHTRVSGIYQKAFELGRGAAVLLVGFMRLIYILSIEVAVEFYKGTNGAISAYHSSS